MALIGFHAAGRGETYPAGVGEGGALRTSPWRRRPPTSHQVDHCDRPTPGRPASPPSRRTTGSRVMFTSGTTSQPEGVVLTQANYRTVAEEMAAAVHLGPDYRWLVVLPMFHANGQYCFFPAIAAGGSVALTASFSASRWVDSARELGATHASSPRRFG